jgi:hypothetical protein
MHHDETGSRAVGQWLLDPFSAVPQFAGFELNADVPAMPLERAGFGGPPSRQISVARRAHPNILTG